VSVTHLALLDLSEDGLLVRSVELATETRVVVDLRLERVQVVLQREQRPARV